MTSEANTVPGSTGSAGNGLTLRAQVREALRAGILRGDWRTHDRLPSENELIERHGVSRITVRQALADLAGDGLIVRVQGKGSFVAPAPVRQELSRLQGLSEALGGQGREVLTRVLSLGQAGLPARAAQALGLPAGTPCVELQTLRFADGQPLSLNSIWIEPTVGDTLDEVALAQTDLLTIYESALNLRVTRAAVDIGAALATARQRKLLGLADPAAVLRVERTVFTTDDRPLHFESSIYRPEAFSYRLELAR